MLENFRFTCLRIASLPFGDDVVLLASLSSDLQQSLERFAANCEAAGMRISISTSEAVVLSQMVNCPFHVGNELVPRVKEFKNVRVLFISRKQDSGIGSICYVGVHEILNEVDAISWILVHNSKLNPHVSCQEIFDSKSISDK